MKFNGIVFSGLPGAGKSALVQKLATRFGWPVFSAGGQWRKKYGELYPDHRITFEEYWRNIPVDEKIKFNDSVDEVYSEGKVVGDSRYPVNLRKLPLLLIFMTADLETRAARALALGKYGAADIDGIKSILSARENDEIKTGFDLFNYDYRDPNYYHLVLNSAKLSIDQEAKAIGSIVKP